MCGAPATNRGRCDRHKRGTTTQRGYNQNHKAIRARLAPYVAAGKVRCAKCLQYIQPGDDWDLGHHTDRSQYTGPEHMSCNRSAAAKLRNA